MTGNFSFNFTAINITQEAAEEILNTILRSVTGAGGAMAGGYQIDDQDLDAELAPEPNLLSDNEFRIKYRKARNKVDSSYDPRDVSLALEDYKRSPEKYGWVVDDV